MSAGIRVTATDLERQDNDRRARRPRPRHHPREQGSRRSFKGMRGKHAVMVEADDNLPAWRKAVIAAAENAKLAAGWLMLNEPSSSPPGCTCRGRRR
jgi:hypothetical protein